MPFDEEHEVLESVFVEMDPILHGFCGVLVELVGRGGVRAAGTGNRLLRYSSKSPELAYAFFEAELRSPK
jgi:hypothetical protein